MPYDKESESDTKRLNQLLKEDPSQVKKDLITSFKISSQQELPEDQLLDSETNRLLKSMVQRTIEEEPELAALVEEALSFEKDAKQGPPRH